MSDISDFIEFFGFRPDMDDDRDLACLDILRYNSLDEYEAEMAEAEETARDDNSNAAVEGEEDREKMTIADTAKLLTTLIDDYQAEVDRENDTTREAMLKELISVSKEFRKKLFLLIGYDTVFPKKDKNDFDLSFEDMPF